MLTYDEILCDLKTRPKSELAGFAADLLFAIQKFLEDVKNNSEDKKPKHRKPKHMDELQITC